MELRCVRQAVDLLDRVVKLAGISTGEITPGRAEFRCKERVTDKCCITGQVGNTVIGVAGRFHYADFQIANRKDISLSQQKIKLAAIDRNFRNIEYPRKSFLYRTYAFTAGNPCSGAFAYFSGCGQMICVCMGFQHPIDTASLLFCSIQHPVHERKVR